MIDGPAGVLDAWLWRRRDSEGISIAGDRAVHERFLAIVDNPIN
ncbi:hypothetical protein [Nocardioides piscis]|nr:hypothetical protein [Nocardioides piscis]